MKYHPDETTIEMTGHRDGMNAGYLKHSEAIAKMCHTVIENLKDYAGFLDDVGHNGRFVRKYVTYVYPYVDWAGQYDHRNRKVKINAVGNDLDHITDTVIHELAHCFYANAEFLKMGMQKEDFKNAIQDDLGSIDSYSRSRKLKGYMKRKTSLYINEIHSILTEMKYGTQKLKDLLNDEDFTNEERQRLSRYIPIYDNLHSEPTKNKEWDDLGEKVL